MKNLYEMGFQELECVELMNVEGGGERWDAFCDFCSNAWDNVKSAAASFYEGFKEGFDFTNIMDF